MIAKAMAKAAGELDSFSVSESVVSMERTTNIGIVFLIKYKADKRKH